MGCYGILKRVMVYLMRTYDEGRAEGVVEVKDERMIRRLFNLLIRGMKMLEFTKLNCAINQASTLSR